MHTSFAPHYPGHAHITYRVHLLATYCAATHLPPHSSHLIADHLRTDAHTGTARVPFGRTLGHYCFRAVSHTAPAVAHTLAYIAKHLDLPRTSRRKHVHFAYIARALFRAATFALLGLCIGRVALTHLRLRIFLSKVCTRTAGRGAAFAALLGSPAVFWFTRYWFTTVYRTRISPVSTLTHRTLPAATALVCCLRTARRWTVYAPAHAAPPLFSHLVSTCLTDIFAPTQRASRATRDLRHYSFLPSLATAFLTRITCVRDVTCTWFTVQDALRTASRAAGLAARSSRGYLFAVTCAGSIFRLCITCTRGILS